MRKWTGRLPDCRCRFNWDLRFVVLERIRTLATSILTCRHRHNSRHILSDWFYLVIHSNIVVVVPALRITPNIIHRITVLCLPSRFVRHHSLQRSDSFAYPLITTTSLFDCTPRKLVYWRNILGPIPNSVSDQNGLHKSL